MYQNKIVAMNPKVLHTFNSGKVANLKKR